MEEETRQEKFRRIAERRMSRIFSNMNLIANLSSKKNYMYSNQEITELFEAYMKKGAEIRKYFDSPITLKNNTISNFKFSEDNKEKSVKEDKFRRVAENRMSRVFSDMTLIANLSNKKHYTYSVQEVDELFQAYEEKGLEIRAFFEPLKEKFTFSK
ncbi:hypothetical protein [Clostridium sp. YIM B02506]|uniref:hypothetical protein n=1 Tax=Clostridium sp. YIM B02506 TaxID=2910680 RepID=UPI001EED38CE|nr:hypothetical protein [Clostridium sp. YIM B02506]